MSVAEGSRKPAPPPLLIFFKIINNFFYSSSNGRHTLLLSLQLCRAFTTFIPPLLRLSEAFRLLQLVPHPQRGPDGNFGAFWEANESYMGAHLIVDAIVLGFQNFVDLWSVAHYGHAFFSIAPNVFGSLGLNYKEVSP